MKGYDHVSRWYDDLVKDKGHYYHINVIIPNVLKLLQNKKSVLDLACGQGILQRYLDKDITYLGADISANMIQKANHYNKNKKHTFICRDLSKIVKFEKNDFEAACIILSLQDIENPLNILKNASEHLVKNGHLIIVINHPCFRIPRQSFWEIDNKKKLQYRRVDKYLSHMKIPILVSYKKNNNIKPIISNHFPIKTLSEYLYNAGFYIERIDEWISDKKSTGSKAKMEDEARDQFPLFMAICAIKK
jgi:SAM-dependent methyltransferase